MPTVTARVLPKLQRHDRAVAFHYAQADRPGRTFFRNCDFDPQFLARRATRGIGDVLGNEKRDGLIQHCQFLVLTLDEADVQVRGTVTAFLRIRLGYQSLTFDAEGDRLRRLPNSPRFGFLDSARLYNELQTHVTAANRKVRIIGSGECPHAGPSRAVVEQLGTSAATHPKTR